MNDNIIKKTIKIIPIEVSVIRTGKSTKNGKTFDWTISKVIAVVLPGEKRVEFSTFDDFSGEINMETEAQTWQETNTKDGKTYTNNRLEKPRRSVWQELNDLQDRVKQLENQIGDLEASKVGDGLGKANSLIEPENASQTNIYPLNDPPMPEEDDFPF